ncbi:MAG: GSCFA domain-containing protein [Bacteroidaceae bacterium]|nr:GSCFA domain-containing protein [Bacteroidaceae bacterium]
MMPLMTPVVLPKQAPRIVPSTRFLLVGSCFATHIGGQLQRSGLQVEVNPFGVVYNPESIALALEAMLDERLPDACFFEGRDNLWHSWLHASEFSAPDEATCRKRVGERFSEACGKLRQADVICFTFGTNRVYEHAGRVVGNCHKEPASQFVERSLTVQEIVERWHTLLERIRTVNPTAEIIFTVSPYRYAKYGMVENQRAKATLLLAIEELTREMERVHYFPAYEILLDELRDYRFYASDMLHPSEVAVNYIWQRFTSWAFTPEVLKFAQEWERTERDLAHRPLNPESDAHKAFLEKVMARRAQLECERLTVKG